MVEILQPSFIVSFNYRHLISKSIIEYMGEHIINLHTSYLPYNRGSNPNFFSFYDNTPKGVTIHRMEEGLDTGDILVQKECLFEESKESFETTYECLIREISQLFYEHWNGIKRGEVIPVPQTGQATYHTKKELVAIQEKVPFQWSEKIEVVCKRLHSKGNG
ncbi:MAG: formyltransferase family protein [Eubacteriales bacterium]